MKSAAISAFPYRTQAVRDLAWACFSRPMLSIAKIAGENGYVTDCGLALTPARQRWLQQLDDNPAPLLAWVERQPGSRLGLQFERLWHFFLEQDPTVELVAHNLPVRDRGRTLGEFDVIYWCHQRQRHFHLELAVKFYLAHRDLTTTEPRSQWREWLGPNAKDRLDLKLDQLLHRQIRLGEQIQGRAQLAKLGITDLCREIAIKGYLFQSLGDPLPPPPGVTPPPEYAQWLPLAGLQRFLAELQAPQFLILPKSRWLSPAAAGVQDELISRSILAERLHSALTITRRAMLVAAIDPDGVEQCRFFVTPDGWPATSHSTDTERS